MGEGAPLEPTEETEGTDQHGETEQRRTNGENKLFLAAPLAGAVSATDGGWFAAATVMVTAADEPRKPAASEATAVSTYVPDGTGDHVTLYGGAEAARAAT